MSLIRKLFLHNWFKMLYVNFHCLPIKQAVKFPIDIYGCTRIVSLTGNISIKEPVHTGMIKLGSQGRDMFPHDPVILDIRGDLCFHGNFYIGCGSTIRVEENAVLEIGENSRFGAQTIIFCENKISIGKQVEGSWRCQLMDTDRHSIIDTDSGNVYPYVKPIVIGDNIWIGNNVTINKGTILPSNLIVASCSLCNRDYNDIKADSIIGGIPARILSTNKRRIWKK